MVATYINCLTIILGSLIGLFMRSKIRSDIRNVIFASSGFVSLTIGMKMALTMESFLIMMLSLAFGGIIGFVLDFEGGILKIGVFFEKITSRKNPGHSEEFRIAESKNFAKGFLEASILFCAGAMTIVGAINAGLDGNYELILIKSVMDGFMAILFTAAYGIGVIFSVVTILVYQGGLTLAAGWIAPLMGEAGLAGISAVGGVLIMMIGLNLLGIKEFKTANFLPALLIVLILTAISPWFSEIYLSLIT